MSARHLTPSDDDLLDFQPDDNPPDLSNDPDAIIMRLQAFKRTSGMALVITPQNREEWALNYRKLGGSRLRSFLVYADQNPVDAMDLYDLDPAKLYPSNVYAAAIKWHASRQQSHTHLDATTLRRLGDSQ